MSAEACCPPFWWPFGSVYGRRSQIGTSGASTETLREGVREASVVALGLIVYSARGAITVPIATRLVQIAGAVPAVVAVYQLAAGTGMDVASHIRPNGTFAHPNSAAMFFAVAAIASLWRYLDHRPPQVRRAPSQPSFAWR